MSEINAVTNEALNSIFVLRERALTGKHLQQATWEIWSAFRDNPTSLDSERMCAMLAETIEAAVASVQARVEGASSANHQLKLELRAARVEISELSNKVQDLEKENTLLGSALAKAKK